MRRSWVIIGALLAAVAFPGCDGDPEVDAGPDMDAGPEAPDGGATCSDGERNQDETDVDCGGVCGPTCAAGDACRADDDCVTRACDAGVCGEAASCSDGRVSGMETDVDCGGLECEPCDDDQGCLVGTDCMSGVCGAMTCDSPICGDGVVNGDDTCDEGGGGVQADAATCDADCTAVACGDGRTNFAAGEECDGDGTGAPGETATCDDDCTAAMCGDGVLNATAGEDCDGDGMGAGGETATCDEDCTPQVCGDAVLNEAAGEGCDDGNMDDTDRCDSACMPTGPDLEITSDATFDTTAGTLDGVAAAAWDATNQRLVVDDFTIAPRVTLTVVGDAPFHVLAAGRVEIAGTLDAAGRDGGDGPGCNAEGGAGGAPGPGGFAGGAGGVFMNTTLDGFDGTGPGAGTAGTGDDAGGGGAGHLGSGRNGVADGSGTAGLAGLGYQSLITLTGGSGGGGGSGDDDDPSGLSPEDDGGGGGGGGGGAVVLDALGDILVSGLLDAGGGDGGASGCSAGGGGGGSGGTVLVMSPRAIDTSGGTLDVSGGRGPGNGGDGAPGQLYVGPVPTCGDGVVNQDETDVDCGGTVCGGCAIRATCRVDIDCAAGDCVLGFCQAAACSDGTQNGSETDVDCGGAACLPCGDGRMCAIDNDCEGTCAAGVCESCADGTRNQDETDVDCGGASCEPCADGLGCALDSDCAGSGCEGGVCVSCVDGVLNDQETALDCGGAECAGCAGGEACNVARDCLSGDCTGAMCAGDALSCQEILTRYPRYRDGTYTIAPNGTPVEVRCDMTTDGGGWTMVGASLAVTLDDEASPYYADLALSSPTMANPGLWSGMRALISGGSDIRFTCRATPGPGPMTVDLSFYANDMYRSFTEGDDAASCSRTYGATATPAFPARRDNLSGMIRPEGDTFDCSADAVGPIVEDFCGDQGDFTVDFDDHGMDCNGSDGTDWGEDDATRKCGTAGLTDGEWHVWVRE